MTYTDTINRNTQITHKGNSIFENYSSHIDIQYWLENAVNSMQVTQEKAKKLLKRTDYLTSNQVENKIISKGIIPDYQLKKRSFSIGWIEHVKFEDLVSINPLTVKDSTDPRVERRKFIKYLRKLKSKHKKQLENVRNVVIDWADRIVTNKIVNFQQAVNKEVKELFSYTQHLKEKIEDINAEKTALWKLIVSYERLATEKTIRYSLT